MSREQEGGIDETKQQRRSKRQGSRHEVKAKVIEKVGRATNSALENEGTDEKVSGTV